MATIKKPGKKKDGGKPSTVLIIFLVFFILLSIGLGVFSYYGYEGQNKLREEAIAAKKTVTTQKSLDDYRMGVIYFLANALGQDLDQEAKIRAVQAFDDLLKENGKYNNEGDRGTFAKLFESIKAEIPFNDAQKAFTENFRTRLKKALDDQKAAETLLAESKKALQNSQAQYAAYEKKAETLFANLNTAIGKNNAAALAKAAEISEGFKKLVEQNKDIQTAKEEADTKAKAEIDNLQIVIARLNKQLEERKTNTAEVVPLKRSGDEHALFLDLSRGGPLWDKPLGRVTRVDLDRRQVFINLGADAGVRPELTFNVFANDGKGNPDKFMKGTLEVIRVVDGQTSMCRITSLYDPSGQEIALNDPTGGRIAREVESALREGDLLFNMFWNQHIAITGAINFTGFPIDAPSEQMRQIMAFSQLLERMGIHTDGYLDLTDGQMKGSYSNKARFLVLGQMAQAKNVNDAAQVERAKMINDGIASMKKEALDKGLFLISAENFAIASGYRRPRNANNDALAGFRPTVPLAGANLGGLVIQRDRPAEAGPMPMLEKKEPEAKEKKEPEPKEKKEPEAKEKKEPEAK